MVDFSVSLLSELEPMLGAALALNLAYVYLDWFHNLQKIGKTARTVRGFGSDKEGLDSDVSLPTKSHSAEEIIKDNGTHNHVRCIKYLSSLGTDTKEDFALPWIKGLLWVYFLLVLFISRFDRIFSFLFIAYISTLLMLGVAHSVGLYPHSVNWFSLENIRIHFIISAIAFWWPLIMAATAAWVRYFVGLFVTQALGYLVIHGSSSIKGMIKDAPK